MDYAMVEFWVDGKRTENKPIDLYKAKGVSPTGRVSLGHHLIRMGVTTLGVKIVGVNAKAKPGLMFGLDYVEMKRVE
jgi:hypothetical protein